MKRQSTRKFTEKSPKKKSVYSGMSTGKSPEKKVCSQKSLRRKSQFIRSVDKKSGKQEWKEWKKNGKKGKRKKVENRVDKNRVEIKSEKRMEKDSKKVWKKRVEKEE